MSHLGFNSVLISSTVPTTSGGSLLTRLPPFLRVIAAAGDMAPARLPIEEGARIEPLSSNVAEGGTRGDPGRPGSLRKRGGGAKSRAVKVVDLRKLWLFNVSKLSFTASFRRRGTHGLGMTAKSS